mmetsp:Transcript_7865/g.8056  ORF Transcript_7865/g.8056 Transcript_7865/m.8056 type:complete len:281 (-) Transcript_7865:446-1288(-)
MRFDLTCLNAALLFFIANVVRLIQNLVELKHYLNKEEFSWEKWKALDVNYLQSTWQIRVNEADLSFIGDMLNVLAWLSFSIPILQIGWILSKGGKRYIQIHSLMVGLVIVGTSVEIVANLMKRGQVDALQFLSGLNINNWTGSNDGTGWRVLEMLHIVTDGITLWVDAFEWLAMSGIFIIIYFSSSLEKKGSTEPPSFGTKWSQLGLFIGILCFIDFIASILRLLNWIVFLRISLAISFINTIVLLPIWLVILGTQLPSARSQSDRNEATNDDHDTAIIN